MLSTGKRHPINQGLITTFLLRRSIFTLVIWFLTGMLLLIILFAGIYTLLNGVEDNIGITQGFGDSLFFSATIQTTVGYGNFTPVGLSKVVMVIQSIIGLLYNVLFLGIVVVKLLWPPDSIVVSNTAVFDNLEQKFRFRFYNTHRLPICDTRYTISLRGVAKSGRDLMYRNFRVAIQFPGHPIIESRRPWIVNTKPCERITFENSEALDSTKDNVLLPEHLKENTTLILQIEGYYPGMGSQRCSVIKRIPVHNIECGRLSLVEEIDTSGQVLTTNWDNFDHYIPTDMETCVACSRHEKCFLAKRLY